MIDDILFFAATKAEHNSGLMAVLECHQKAGITLNEAKCQFCKTSIHFCEYIIDNEGVLPDPAKTEALALIPHYQNVADVR